MGVGLSIAIYNPSPYLTVAPVVEAGTPGAIAAGTYSFVIVGNGHPTGALTDMDAFWVDRTFSYDGVVVAADKQLRCTLQNMSPSISLLRNKPHYPRNWMVLAQPGATFNFAATSAIVAISNSGRQRVLVVTDDTSLGAVTLGTTGVSWTVAQLYRLEWTRLLRTNAPTFDGGPGNASNITQAAVRAIRISMPGGQVLDNKGNNVRDSISRLLKLKSWNTIFRVTDHDTTAPILTYEGVITGVNFTNSEGKDDGPYTFDMDIHGTLPGTQVPIGDPTP